MTIITIGLALTAVVIIFTEFVGKGQQTKASPISRQRIFHASRWIKAIVLLEITLSLSIWGYPYFVANTPSAFLLYGSLSLLFITIGIAAYIRLNKVYVAVDRDVVVYFDGKKENRVNRHEIQSVYVSTGYMVVDCGRIPRLAIPLVFENNRKMLEVLQ